MKKIKAMITAGIISASILVGSIFSTIPAMADTGEDLVTSIFGLYALDYLTGGVAGDLLYLGAVAEALDGFDSSYDAGSETDDTLNSDLSDVDNRINVTDETAGFGFYVPGDWTRYSDDEEADENVIYYAGNDTGAIKIWKYFLADNISLEMCIPILEDSGLYYTGEIVTVNGIRCIPFVDTTKTDLRCYGICFISPGSDHNLCIIKGADLGDNDDVVDAMESLYQIS